MSKEKDLNEENVVDESTTVETPVVENEIKDATDVDVNESEKTTEEQFAEGASSEQSATEKVEEPEVVKNDEPSVEDVLKDRLARLQADFDNYKKRMARDRVELIKGANSELLESLLPVLDNIDNALLSMQKFVTDENKGYYDGVEQIKGYLIKALSKYGLDPIEDSIGKQFDVNYHEAISKMPMEGKEPNEILYEARKGYTLNGKVLRHTQVVVVAGEE